MLKTNFLKTNVTKNLVKKYINARDITKIP